MEHMASVKIENKGGLRDLITTTTRLTTKHHNRNTVHSTSTHAEDQVNALSTSP